MRHTTATHSKPHVRTQVASLPFQCGEGLNSQTVHGAPTKTPVHLSGSPRPCSACNRPRNELDGCQYCNACSWNMHQLMTMPCLPGASATYACLSDSHTTPSHAARAYDTPAHRCLGRCLCQLPGRRASASPQQRCAASLLVLQLLCLPCWSLSLSCACCWLLWWLCWLPSCAWQVAPLRCHPQPLHHLQTGTQHKQQHRIISASRVSIATVSF